MFESLSEKLGQVFARLRGKGTLSEAEIQAGLREIRQALLAADVHYQVVRDLITRVEEQAREQKIVQSLTPAQHLLALVRQEMARAMGGEGAKLQLTGKPAVIVLVGPAGSGKTTTAGKLGQFLKHKGRKPALVCADPIRPAAAEQLSLLAQKVGLPFASASTDPVSEVLQCVEQAKRELWDVLVVDTPGTPPGTPPLPFIEELIHTVKPSDVLLVLDAMVGQEAVRMGQAFQSCRISGVVLTKLDGDARGGAALSLPQRLGHPVIFAGTGEKPADLEPFHPERMADRILGLGDLAGLVEKLAEAQDEKLEERAEKIRRGEFTLEDFLAQIEAMNRAGPLGDLVARLPGLGQRVVADDLEEEVKRTRAIIQSMTVEERRNPHIIGASRKRRIARGSGTTVQEVNQLLSQYEQARKLMKEMGKRRWPPGWGVGTR